MTSSGALSPAVSGISKELAEMRHLVQFPEEIACILTEQEQQLYQRVRGIRSHIKKKYQGCSLYVNVHVESPNIETLHRIITKSGNGMKVCVLNSVELVFHLQ